MRTVIFKVEEVRFPGRDYFNSKRVSMMVLNAMRKEGNQMKKELESTVQHWVHKPNFKYKMHYKGADVYIEAKYYGSYLATKYWYFVDKGTSYRYAIFHPFYQPKTFVGSQGGSFFSNTPGKYTVTKKVGGSYTQDSKIQGISPYRLRGIRARNWTKLLREKHALTYPRAIVTAIQRGLQPR